MGERLLAWFVHAEFDVCRSYLREMTTRQMNIRPKKQKSCVEHFQSLWRIDSSQEPGS